MEYIFYVKIFRFITCVLFFRLHFTIVKLFFTNMHFTVQINLIRFHLQKSIIFFNSIV